MKTYTGKRTPLAQVWVLDNQGGHPLPSMNGLDNKLDWGYLGKPPENLAFALLLYHSGSLSLAESFAPSFMSEIVSRLQDGWILKSSDIQDWLERVPEERAVA